MNDDTDRSEILPLRQARRQFLESTRGNVKESTVRSYKFLTRHFVEFYENKGVLAVGDVDGYVIESWIKDRRSDDIKRVTLQNNVKHVRVFIRWGERTDLIEYGMADRIQVPQLHDNEAVSEETLRLGQAEEVLQYLDTYEYGSRKHALFLTLWHTGCRISGALALADFGPDYEPPLLKFRNRPSRGTPLKNRNKSERNVSINQDLAEVLNDYLALKREGVRDDFDRDPLFTTPNGRVTRQRAYQNFVPLSRPCHTADTCPHDREINSCEAAQFSEKVPACPSSVSLHPIRRGSITYQINQGCPKEKLSERVDVSVDVLNRHYDARTREEERKGREGYMDLL